MREMHEQDTSGVVDESAAENTVGLECPDPVQPEIEADHEPEPDEPLRRNELAHWLGLPLGQVVGAVRRLQPEFPALFSRDSDDALLCEPVVASLVRRRLTIVPTSAEQPASDATATADSGPAHTANGNGERARRRIVADFHDFGEEMKSGETVNAKTFASLITIFGAESAFDVLYRFRAEYKDNIPMPIVRSFLADYLGEFIVTPGKMDWDSIGEALPYLNDTKLQATLANVIKRDCLRKYNLKKRNNPGADDFNVIADYLAEIEAKIETLEDQNLNAVVRSVNNYYESVFFFDLPTSTVDSLKAGRPFPDLNQRINIYETMRERRILIADDPGMGKSASAILAKEAVGARLAVILTPSAVLEEAVWQQYLSADVGENGKQLGYFKPGQEPRVLVADSAQKLASASAEDYDYVLVSHERLDREGYCDALKELGFDMLVVDEAHGFKNIVDGKRAAKLIDLATTLEDDEHLMLLTATPAPNKVVDIAMMLRLLYPDKFQDHDDPDLVMSIINGDILGIRSLLLPKLQQKNLADTNEVIPAEEVLRWIPLSGDQRKTYQVMLDEWELAPQEKLRFLRQILLNPGILDGTPDVASAKLDLFSAELAKLYATNQKILMFVNGFVNNVISGEDTIMDRLQVPDGVIVDIIHGGVGSRLKRREIFDGFRNREEPSLLIVSGQTVSMGLDLSAADVVIMYNEPWTETDKRQQFGRSLRPGRDGKLIMETGIFAGTIEEGIHDYIKVKSQAIDKLLRGIPLTEAEKSLVVSGEKSDEEGLEVNAELAQYYYSSIDRMNRMFGLVKENGEEWFRDFLTADNDRYAKEYATTYRDLTVRSYQANASRLAGSLISRLNEERDTISLRDPDVIVDIGSGPEMLRRHIPEHLARQVISIDINERHFAGAQGECRTGTLRSLPLPDGSVQFANMSLAWHYTAWQPKAHKFERLEALGELNRVLKPGGTAVITMPYSLNLRNDGAFATMAQALGFSVVAAYSGTVTSGHEFRSKVVTLRKNANVRIGDPRVFMRTAGDPTVMSESLRFVRREVQLRDQRRMAPSYSFETSGVVLGAELNDADKAVRDEEQAILGIMEHLRYSTDSLRIADIPADEILLHGLARVFNGKQYLLFKHLENGGGAVTYRGA